MANIFSPGGTQQNQGRKKPPTPSGPFSLGQPTVSPRQRKTSVNIFSPKSTDIGATPGPTIKDVEEPTFELMFGFIPTINVGNAFGVKNDVARTAMNILLDPIGLGLAFFTGGATALGKVAASSKALNMTKSVLKAAPGVTAAKRVETAKDTLRLLQKAELNPAATEALRAAVEAKDVRGFVKAAKQLNKTPVPIKEGLLPTNRELHELLKLQKAEEGVLSGLKGVKDLDAAVTKGLVKKEQLELGVGALEKAERGQLAAVQFRVPFTPKQTTVGKFGEGKPIFALYDKLFKPTKRLSQRTIDKLSKAGYTAHTIDEMAEALFKGRWVEAGKTAENALTAKRDLITGIEKMAEGSAESLGKLLPFLKEGTEIPLSAFEKAGLAEDLARLGIKPMIVQKAGPLISRKDTLKLLNDKGWLKAAGAGNKAIKKTFDDLFDVQQKAGLFKDEGYIRRYVSHIWDIAPNSAAATSATKKLLQAGRANNQRKLKTIIDGLNEGHSLKFDNVYDIVEEAHKEVGRVLQDRQILKFLTKGQIKLEGVAKPVSLFTTKARLHKLGIADEFVPVSEGLEKALGKTFRKRFQKTDKATGAVTERITQRLYVHKELAKDLENIFGAENHSMWAQGLTRFIATAKGLALSSSLFHSFALTESAIATLGFKKGLVETAKLGFGVPGMKRLANKLGAKSDEALMLSEEAGDGMRAGLNIHPPSDAQISMLEKTLESAEQALLKVPGAKAIVEALPKSARFGPKRYTERFNKALWDNFHNPLKLRAWQIKVKQFAKANPNLPMDQIKRDAADFVNDAFGGQNWQQLMVNPKFKQKLHWLLLAPDWTISNLRIAGVKSRNPGQIKEGLTGVARGIFGKGLDPSEQAIGQYWRNAGLFLLTSTALLNKAVSGRWLWDNPPGHKLDISTGDVDEKGREQFTKLGKQYREPLRWLIEPQIIGGAKLSPAIQLITEQLSGRTTTGFPTELARQPGQLPMSVMEQVPARAKIFVDKFVPFSLGGKNFFWALPKSSYTETQATQGIVDAIKGTKGLGSDAAAVREILKLSLASGHDINRIKGMVRRNVGDPRGLLDQILE